MATAAQIAANRCNAQKSTGPRSAAGKMRSRYNAFRHGLAVPLSADIGSADEIDALAAELAAAGAPRTLNEAARRAALAQLELARIEAVKLGTINKAAQKARQASGCELDEAAPMGFLHKVSELKRLYRYERRALSQRRRALRLLDAVAREISKTRPVRRSTRFVQPAWVFNVHALARESVVRSPQMFVTGSDPMIGGLRVTTSLYDDTTGEIEFAFGPSYTLAQQFPLKTIGRRGGRHWAAICPTSGKIFEELFVKEGESLIGSRFALGLTYKSKQSQKTRAAQQLANQLARASALADTELLILSNAANACHLEEPDTDRPVHSQFDQTNGDVASTPSAARYQSEAKKLIVWPKTAAIHVTAGNLDAALADYKNVIANCEAARGRISGARIRKGLYRARSSIARLAFEYLLRRNFGQAHSCIDDVLAHYPRSAAFKIMKAHALLFSGRGEEARAIYLEHIDKTFSQWRDCYTYIRDDFDKLRRAGLTHPRMEEIELEVLAAERGEVTSAKPKEAPADTVAPAPDKIVAPSPLLPDDINLGDRAVQVGKLKTALEYYRRCFSACEGKCAETANDTVAKANADTAANRIACLAFQFLLKKYVHQALDAVEQIVTARPGWIWVRLIQAHALMFTARKTDALNIHRKYCGQFHQDGEPWGATIRGDFAALCAAGYPRNPIMDYIEQQFATKD